MYKENMSKLDMAVASTEQEESFIIQNITLGYHFVSDINLQFAPGEVKDLTWEDPLIIKKSRNLKDSIRSGVLRKLTPEEYEKTMDLQYQKEKKQLLREQEKKTQYRKLKDRDGKELVAETFEVDKAKRKQHAEIDITGTANHPMSFVTAFSIAQNLATDNGDILTAEEFAEMVNKDSGIVERLLSRTKQASIEKNHKAYYALPPNDYAFDTGVGQGKMTNYNRDMLNPGDRDDYAASDKIRDAVDLDGSYDPDGEDGDPLDNDGFAEEIIIDEE